MLFAVMITEFMQYAVRGAAAVVGLIAGWYLSKPIANLLSRLAFQRPVANEILPLVRVFAAVALAALFYFIVPAGTGDGTGFGPGGDGPGGDQKGRGAGKDKASDKSTDKSGKGDADKAGPGIDKSKKIEDPSPDLIRVEILGGSRYPGMEKWYVFQGKDPPLNKGELKERIREYLKANMLKSARLQPIITPDTVATWRSTREPELLEIRMELGLQPVDPEMSNLMPE